VHLAASSASMPRPAPGPCGAPRARDRGPRRADGARPRPPGGGARRCPCSRTSRVATAAGNRSGSRISTPSSVRAPASVRRSVAEPVRRSSPLPCSPPRRAAAGARRARSGADRRDAGSQEPTVPSRATVPGPARALSASTRRLSPVSPACPAPASAPARSRGPSRHRRDAQATVDRVRHRPADARVQVRCPETRGPSRPAADRAGRDRAPLAAGRARRRSGRSARRGRPFPPCPGRRSRPRRPELGGELDAAGAVRGQAPRSAAGLAADANRPAHRAPGTGEAGLRRQVCRTTRSGTTSRSRSAGRSVAVASSASVGANCPGPRSLPAAARGAAGRPATPRTGRPSPARAAEGLAARRGLQPLEGEARPKASSPPTRRFGWARRRPGGPPRRSAPGPSPVRAR